MLEFIQKFDESILFYIQENLKNPVLDQFMIFITKLGNAGFIWILIAFLLLCQKRYQKCGIPLICALSLAMLLSDDVLKPLFGRVRPNVKFPEIPLLIGGISSSPSFPSGHTAVGFASAATIYHYHKVQGNISFILAALIAFSRLYLFVHYPSDILGGMILGFTTSFLVIYGIERIYSHFPNHQR